MGRYWLRTEEEEAQFRAELERRAAEEAERYRAEPSSPPSSAVPAPSPLETASSLQIRAPEPQRASWAERLAATDRLSPLNTIPLLDKLESFAKSDADDKLETVEADDSDDSDAQSDGGASTALGDESEEGAVGTSEENLVQETCGGARLRPVGGPAEPASDPENANPPATAQASEEAGRSETGENKSTREAVPVPLPAEAGVVAVSWLPAAKAGPERPTPKLRGDSTAANTAMSKPESETTQGAASSAVPFGSVEAAGPAAQKTDSAEAKCQLLEAETPLAQREDPLTTVAAPVTASVLVANAAPAGAGAKAGIVKGTGATSATALPLNLPATNINNNHNPHSSQIATPTTTSTPSDLSKGKPISSVLRPTSPVLRPTSPALRHKKTMASMASISAAVTATVTATTLASMPAVIAVPPPPTSSPPPKANHLHLSGRRTRRYIGDHKQEIMA
jgi:hypothetical protein